VTFALNFAEIDYPNKPPTIEFTDYFSESDIHPGVSRETNLLSTVALERAPWHPLLGVQYCIDYVQKQFDALTNPDT
jgi:ubiquitin-protein ligase